MSESLVPKPDEIIRNCTDALLKEQEEFAIHMAESLAALESYEQQLHEWQAELTSESDRLMTEQRELEEKRKQFIKQQATDVAMTAELDQARAEIDDLRHRLNNTIDPVVAASVAATTESVASSETKSNGGVGLLDPAISTVAKQFHKLRKQQAARRSGSRTTIGN